MNKIFFLALFFSPLLTKGHPHLEETDSLEEITCISVSGSSGGICSDCLKDSCYLENGRWDGEFDDKLLLSEIKDMRKKYLEKLVSH